MKTLVVILFSISFSLPAVSSESEALSPAETFSFISHLAPQLLLDAETLQPMLNPEPVFWDKNLPNHDELEAVFSHGDQRLDDSSLNLSAEH